MKQHDTEDMGHDPKMAERGRDGSRPQKQKVRENQDHQKPFEKITRHNSVTDKIEQETK